MDKSGYTCEHCDKPAIGYQAFGCCFAYVCWDHADSMLRNLKPGERLMSGECCFERFSLPE